MEENLHNIGEPYPRGITGNPGKLPGTGHDRKLTSAEAGNLWAQYLWDNMAVFFLQHFAETVKDNEIGTAIEYAKEVSRRHMVRIKQIFEGENIPVPFGFTEKDVHPQAPRLFSDSLYLYYLSFMAKNGLSLYAQMLATSTRTDIRSHYSEGLDSIRELDNISTEILLSRGLYIRPPNISVPDKIDFVEKQSFLGSIWGSERKLLAIEIAHLFFNMQRNSLGKAILIGFSQVARTREVRGYFLKGIEIAHKHIEIFSSLLKQDGLPAPIIRDIEITDSAASPFSDKMMLYHTTFLTSVSTSFYGTAMGVSSRLDITSSYARLAAEVLKYAGEGADIMISNGWMEEPPQAKDRNSQTKKHH